MARKSVLRRGVALFFLLLVASDCGEGGNPSGPPLPSSEIRDGANNGGNSHFFFLPPLRRQPAPNGTFDATLSPVVEICVLTQCGTSAIATFTMQSGVTVDPVAEQYQVNWPTAQFDLDPAVTYRIRVLAGGVELGHADVNVVMLGSELRRVDTGEYIPLLAGRTLPIKFRIEQGAVRPAFNVTSAASTGNTSVTVTFSQPPNPAEAVNLANYTVPGLALSGPALSGTDVTFTTSSQAAISYTVTVTGVTRGADGEPLTNVNATFTGTPPSNQAPVVDAGADLSVTLPATATLNGTVTDDGLPSGSTLTITWSKISGPGTVTFSNANAASTTASFPEAGTYVLRLRASGGAFPVSDDLTVTVQPAN